MTKLFVGGLAWATDAEALKTAFEAFGKVTEAKVITDRDTGRSRGFGFVTFTNEIDAGNALNAMNESTLDGRTIRVSEAQDKPRSGGSGGNSGGGGGGGGYGGGRDPGPSRGHDSGGGRPPTRTSGRRPAWDGYNGDSD